MKQTTAKTQQREERTPNHNVLVNLASASDEEDEELELKEYEKEGGKNSGLSKLMITAGSLEPFKLFISKA